MSLNRPRISFKRFDAGRNKDWPDEVWCSEVSSPRRGDGAEISLQVGLSPVPTPIVVVDSTQSELFFCRKIGPNWTRVGKYFEENISSLEAIQGGDSNPKMSISTHNHEYIWGNSKSSKSV